MEFNDLNNDSEDFLSRRILEEELLVYVLPKIKILEDRIGIKRKIKNLGVLADGNNRQGGNYDKGGENVILLAENLLMRNSTLAKFFAFILSPENARKRGQGFFQKLSQAFLMLGIRIVTKGMLGGKGIRLSYEGDLEELKQNGLAAEFVEMILAVAKINEEYLQKFLDREECGPDKELVLGINYREDVLQKRKIELLYRSGMEEGDVARFGSTRPDGETWLSADQKLWPQVTAEDLQIMIDQVEKAPEIEFERGYNSAEIEEIIRTTISKFETNQYFKVSLPFYGDFREGERVLRQMVFEEQNEHLPISIHFVSAENSFTYKTQTDYQFWNFVVVNDFEQMVQNQVTAVIAPNQSAKILRVPDADRVRIDYANIFTCVSSSEAIGEKIKAAADFKKNYVALKGAERVIQGKGLHEESSDIWSSEEFAPYIRLQGVLKENLGKSLEEIAELDKTVSGKLEKFNLVADLFVAKMLVWVESLNISWHRDVELRALVNYHLTSFFLTCCPDQNDQYKLIDDWEENAACVARYMTLVYLMDDRVYDLKNENLEKKKMLMEFATAQFTKAVKLEDLNTEDFSEGGVIAKIAGQFRLLAEDLAQKAEAKNFLKWQAKMINLFKCHDGEWDKKICDNNLVDKISEDYDENIDEFFNKYEGMFKSSLLKDMVESGLGNLRGIDQKKRYQAVCDLKLYTYLHDIEDSIGAGLVYRTMACFSQETAGENGEIEGLYEEICLLINIYFRLANDFAEMYRASDDKEGNVDSCSIMYDKYSPYHNKSEALIYGSSEIYFLIENLKKEIWKKRNEFQKLCENVKPWDRVALAIVRSDIAELYYKGTHYREASREMVAGFFEQLFELGLNNR
ncbi:MAG: hypothetical protein ACRCZE_05120 [Candidatus Altimarinota bacterium]